jgi:bacterioferritin
MITSGTHGAGPVSTQHAEPGFGWEQRYDASLDLLEMVREDLIAERVAIQSYSEIIAWLGSDDPTTRGMLEDILAVEEEHADDLPSILQTIAE